MNDKIGHRVSLLATTEGNPRNGEGTFISRRDGSIMYAYSRYTGDSRRDHAPADICAVTSHDDGESWSEPFLLLRHDDLSQNYMCPSFLRLANGDIGLFYLRKFSIEGQTAVVSEMNLVRSSDEGESWSRPVACTSGQIYYVFENDHALRLEHGENAGRILLPLNIHSRTEGSVIKNVSQGLMCFFASDDDGHSWYKLSAEHAICNAPYSVTGLQETAVYEQRDGTLRALSRTDQHCQYECLSSDGGKSWTDNYPAPYFSSPPSPLLMKRAAGMTCAVFNPIPNYAGRYEGHRLSLGRTPLVMSVSDDDGKSFSRMYMLEDDPNERYCYPSIFDGGEFVLVGYYHSNGSGSNLNANVIKKIYKTELE